MEELEPRPRYGIQMLGSLAAALLIVVGTIWAVTARLGPTSIAEREAAEEAAEEEADLAEDAREEQADEERGRRRRGRGR